MNMLNKPGKKEKELSENFNKGTEHTKKDKSELQNTVTKMKNKLEGINSRLDDTEE